MKILLFGKNGQCGWELQRSLAPLGKLVSLGTDNAPLCGNLTDMEGITQTIRKVNPDIIVNAAAYTAVDKAESEPTYAALINAQAPAILAQEAARNGSLLVHYSTDYVFDGHGDTPWTEVDPPAPLNIYGQTKLDGERAILASGCRHLIVRSSWIYATRGSNFAKKIIRLAQEKNQLSVINDQIGAPTGADVIADVTAHMIRATQQDSKLCGLYHLTAGEYVSWYEYARFVLAFAQRTGVALKTTPDQINPIKSHNYPTPAKRPLNSRLNTTKIRKCFNLNLPLWQNGVVRMLNEILDG